MQWLETKKADTAEHMNVLRRVGLLNNASPILHGLRLFVSSEDAMRKLKTADRLCSDDINGTRQKQGQRRTFS